MMENIKQPVVKHTPIIKEREDTNKVILFIHGIFGSPNQFEDIAELFYNKGFSVIALLLPGHGGSAEEFAESGSEQWRKCVKDEIDRLKTRYDHIILVGHSMGGLISLECANEYELDAVILLGTPTYIKPTKRQLGLCFKIMFPKPNKDDEFMKSYRKAYSVRSTTTLGYIKWVPPLIQLLKMIKETKEMLKDIEVPMLICQSREDETIGSKSCEQLIEALSLCNPQLLWLEHSTHSHFSEEDRKKLLETCEQFIDELHI